MATSQHIQSATRFRMGTISINSLCLIIYHLSAPKPTQRQSRKHSNGSNILKKAQCYGISGPMSVYTVFMQRTNVDNILSRIGFQMREMRRLAMYDETDGTSSYNQILIK